MARSLAVLGEWFQSLVDKGHIILINIEPQQAQTSSRASTYTVEKL